MGDLQVYAAMQTERPKKTYIKSQLGKVVVKVLNPFDEKPEEVILEGDPRKYEETCFVDLWDDKQISYFEKMNKRLISTGWIHEISREEVELNKERGIYANYTKKDKIELFDRSFMAFRSFINRVNDIEFLTDLIEVGKEIDAPQSYIKAINGRIESLAIARTPQEPEPEEEYKKPTTKKKKGTKKE